MATFDNPSDLVGRIAFPYRSGLRCVAALPAKEEKQIPPGSKLQGIEAGDIFHGSLLESGGNARPRNPWAAVGSLAFQALLLATVVVIPLFHMDKLPKQEVLTMLYAPPPAAASNAVTLRKVTPASTSRSVVTPAPRITRQEAPPTPVATGEVVGGVPGGLPGGVPGGVLSDMLGSARSVPVLAKTPEPAKRMRVASRIAAANLVHDVAPIYPPEAGRERIEGTVVLMAVIGKDGTVRDVRVESGLPLLAQAAIDAVKQWRYRPYLLNGEPIEVDSQITISFTLSRG